METKCVEVTRARYKAKLLEEVIPAIKASWPASGRRERVRAQHDNAPSHNINDDPDIVRECTRDGWDIQFVSQPANTPDLNILGLGFFNSIQSLQDRTTPRTTNSSPPRTWRSPPERVSNSAGCGRLWIAFCRRSCWEKETTPSKFRT